MYSNYYCVYSYDLPHCIYLCAISRVSANIVWNTYYTYKFPCGFMTWNVLELTRYGREPNDMEHGQISIVLRVYIYINCVLFAEFIIYCNIIHIYVYIYIYNNDRRIVFSLFSGLLISIVVVVVVVVSRLTDVIYCTHFSAFQLSAHRYNDDLPTRRRP